MKSSFRRDIHRGGICNTIKYKYIVIQYCVVQENGIWRQEVCDKERKALWALSEGRHLLPLQDGAKGWQNSDNLLGSWAPSQRCEFPSKRRREEDNGIRRIGLFLMVGENVMGQITLDNFVSTTSHRKRDHHGRFSEHWTDDQLNILRQYYTARELSFLVKAIGKSETAIRVMGKSLGLRRLVYCGRIASLDQLTPVELAYIAGFIDADGSITLNRWAKGDGFQTAVIVTNSDRNVIDWFAGIFHTKVKKRQKSKRGKKDLYYAAVYRLRDTKALLERILPYLKVKKRQGLIALEFCNIRVSGLDSPNRPRTGFPHTKREFELYKEMHQLNHPISEAEA